MFGPNMFHRGQMATGWCAMCFIKIMALSRPLVLCLLLAAVALPLSADATFVFTYDFPGTPGSGLASDQTNSTQPGNAAFGDWARVNVTAGTTADVFDSTFWNNTATFDNTQYEAFDITANAGYHINLSGTLTFDEMRTAGGPTKGRVDIFLNGSTTAFATYTYLPSSTFKGETFNFTPTTDGDNVTSVEFRFYGWNGGTPSASLFLDNVATTIDVVPEVGAWMVALLPISIALFRLVGDLRSQKSRL